MTWTRISDTFTDRPDVIGLTDAAFRLHIEALVWCNRTLTDGAIPNGALRRIAATDTPLEVAAELVGAGLWTATADGYAIDWSDQENAATVRKRREANATRQAAFRGRKELHAAGDHSQCDRRYCKPRNAVTDAATNSTPTPPVPSEGQGQGTRHCARCGVALGNKTACPNRCERREET